MNIKTIQRWDREGRLKPGGRTATGRRYYTEDQILAFRQHRPATTRPRKTGAYCRVSSQSQRPDLANQRLTWEPFCTARGLAHGEFSEEIGGGMNCGRKRFVAVMDAGEIGTVIRAHTDRLTRVGYEWFERFCQQHGCEILVLNQEHWAPEQELVPDLLTITQGFSARWDGLRHYRKSFKEAMHADVSPQDPARADVGSDPVR